jgi:hypothetical protein
VNLINFDQWKRQYVSWQDIPAALASQLEGPDEGIPKEIS